MTRRTQEPVAYETMYGWMEFPSLKKAEEFKKIICSWEGFTVETAPSTIEEAVEFHLAYTKGGVSEVYAVIRAKRERIEHAEAERRVRYMLASLAHRESEFYKEHFSQSHPSYKWGS